MVLLWAMYKNCSIIVHNLKENGEVDYANKMILLGLKKRVNTIEWSWAGQPDKVLMAIRMTWKQVTRKTFFIYTAWNQSPLQKLSLHSMNTQHCKMEDKFESSCWKMDIRRCLNMNEISFSMIIPPSWQCSQVQYGGAAHQARRIGKLIN